jgi:hypothetical protein
MVLGLFGNLNNMAYAQTGTLGFGGFVWSGLEVKLVGQGKSVNFKQKFTGFSFGGGACQLAGKWNINPKDLPKGNVGYTFLAGAYGGGGVALRFWDVNDGARIFGEFYGAPGGIASIAKTGKTKLKVG